MRRRPVVPERCFSEATKDVLARVVARYAEETAVVGRKLGIRYPTTYDVGCRVAEDPNRPGLATIFLRVGPVRESRQLRWKGKGEKFFGEVYDMIQGMILKWAEEDPALSQDLRGMDRSLALKIANDPGGEFTEEVIESARNATYSVMRGQPIMPSELPGGANWKPPGGPRRSN